MGAGTHRGHPCHVLPLRAFHALSRGLLGPVSLSILETTTQGLTPHDSKQAHRDLKLGLSLSKVHLSSRPAKQIRRQAGCFQKRSPGTLKAHPAWGRPGEAPRGGGA